MPDMEAPSRKRRTIICCAVRTKPVLSVRMPKATVIAVNQTRGPSMRTAMVEGSWNTILEMVKMKMDTEKR